MTTNHSAEGGATPPSVNSTADGDDLQVLDALLVIARHKSLILRVTATGAFISLIVSLLLPKIYLGSVVLLPPQQGQATIASALLGQFAAGAGGIGVSSLLKNPADLYVGMLRSRTIADALVSRFDLKTAYEEDTLVETRKELANRTSVTAGKDGLIAIDVEDEDPQRAAAIANAYGEELRRLSETLAVSEASQRRAFFEQQLQMAKNSLAKAETAFMQTQLSTGILKLDDQGRAVIEAIAGLRAQIAAKQVAMTAMRTFATEKNPDYQRLRQEISGLETQLSRLERKNAPQDKGDILIPADAIPEAGAEYVRMYRDVKYHETLFEVMAKQYEIAKIDEARDTRLVQVVDQAVVPDKKHKPKRALIVLLATFLSGGFALALAFVLEGIQRAKMFPEHAERLRSLWANLRIGRNTKDTL